MKQCIDCKEEKRLKEFYNKKSKCKSCVKLKKKLDYKNDGYLAKLEARIRYENTKSALVRIKNFMKRYQ